MSRELDGAVFERPLPRGYVAAFASLFVAALALAWWSGDVASAAARAAAHLPWVDGWTFGWLVHATCIGAAGGVYVVAVGWAGRRYGRAVITRDHVVVTPIKRGVRPIVVPRDDVVALRETPFGLVLSAPAARGGLPALLLPILVPASDADLARAHELFDPARRAARPGATARPKTTLSIFVVVFAPMGLLGALSLWAPNLGPAELGVACAGAIGTLVLGWFALAVERRRVHVGEEAVSVGSLVGAWTSVARVSAWGEWFALELVGGRRQHARVGADAAVRLASHARVSLTALGRDGALGLQRPGWVTRRRALLGAALALLTACYVEAAPVTAWTREGCLGIVDHHGYRLRLVYRAREAAPRLVVIVDPGAGSVGVRAGGRRSQVFADEGATADPGAVWVDVREGRVRRGREEHALPRDATVVHVRAGGVSVSTRPLPIPLTPPTGAERIPSARTELLNLGLDLLDVWLPGHDDPVIRGALDGQTTTRCFSDVTAGGGWLFMQVRRGEVASVALIEPGLVLHHGGVPCGSCGLAARFPGRRVRSTAPHVFVEAALPTFEQVLEARRLVRSGVAVEDTSVGRGPWSGTTR